MDAAPTAGPFTAAELAERLGGTVEGDGEVRLADVRGLEDAGPEHLSFLANPKFARQLATTRAGAVLVKPDADRTGRTVIRLGDPYAAFARALAVFYPRERPEPGVDPRAAVAETAEVDPSATVEAFAWIGPRAAVGARTWIEAGAYVGAGATVGDDCHLMASAVVCHGCEVGDRTILNPGAVVGGDGFGFAPTPEGNVKIPQVGIARIGSDVEIGANTTVDRAAMGATEVAAGAKLDNLVMVAHGARIGEHAMLAAFGAAAGSARIGARSILAGKAGVINHVEIGDGAQVAAGSIVMNDQPAGSRLAGTPAIDHATWLRASTAFKSLPALVARVRALEKRVEELTEEGGGGEEGRDDVAGPHGRGTEDGGGTVDGEDRGREDAP